MAVRRSYFDVPPSAARLTGSLRDIGYDFHTAIADLVDNSIAAGARRIGVELVFDPNKSYVLIWDDGTEWDRPELLEALRFGSRRDYRRNELGRFGLGLKTGSFSQCRRLTWSAERRTSNRRSTYAPGLGLHRQIDSWSVLADEESDGDRPCEANSQRWSRNGRRLGEPRPGAP